MSGSLALDSTVIPARGFAIVLSPSHGPPKADSYVTNIKDDHIDNLPRNLHECSSIERVNPAGADVFNNWNEINNGSPGEALY